MIAQYSVTTPVYTPLNNPVTVYNFIGTDYTSKQKEDNKNYWLNYYDDRIKFESEATYKYNCHAYAWDGNTGVWMDRPQEAEYWKDYSYVDVTNTYPSTATKVSFGGFIPNTNYSSWYNDYNHSAITTSSAGYFSSKWGPGPRFKHLINDCPYLTDDLHYYARPTISGPGIIWCNIVNTFTLNNKPPGTLTWAVTGPFAIASVSGNSVTIDNTWTSVGNGTLTAKIDGTTVASMSISPCPGTITGPTLVCESAPATFTVSNVPQGATWEKSSNLLVSNSVPGALTVYGYTGYSGVGSPGWVSVMYNGVELAKQDVWVGSPVVSFISGPTSVQNGYYYLYNAYMQGILSEPSSFQWDVSPSGSAIINQWDGTANISFSTFYQSFVVSCYACNACGTGQPFYLQVSQGRGGSSAYSVYPNPVSGILTIELDADASGVSRNNNEIVFDCYLYNDQGNLLRRATSEGGKVEFNVSNLPDGFYFLHIYEAESNEPEVHQVMVKH